MALSGTSGGPQLRSRRVGEAGTWWDEGVCGRLAIDELVDALVRAYLAEAVGWEDALTALPNWDVRPTDTIPMLVESARRGGARILAPARWGLLAPGAPATGEPPRFNARLETLGARPARLSARAAPPGRADGGPGWPWR